MFFGLLLCVGFTLQPLCLPPGSALLFTCCCPDADLEDDMSDQDMPAKPPPAPVVHSRRIRIVQSHRRRPPLAPGAKAAAAAADSSKQQKGATTGTGRRSFLTLSVSSGEWRTILSLLTRLLCTGRAPVV